MIKIMIEFIDLTMIKWHKLRIGLSSENLIFGIVLIIVSRARTLYTSFIITSNNFHYLSVK